MKVFMLTSACLLLFVSFPVRAQQSTIKIWNGLAPGTENRKDEEKIEGNNIVNVYQPELTIFLPEKQNKNCPAVLVFPGGGYKRVVIQKEGTKIAQWLNENGIAAFVLKYRLDPIEALQDAQRALSLVRSKAKEYNVNPDEIGVIGFSAGGHLAANLAIHHSRELMADHVDSVNCRPNFAILVYAYTGALPESSKPLYSSVDGDTPPTFLVHAIDDKSVPVDQSLEFYSSLRKAGVQCELHLYEKGGHGFALENDRGPVKSWAGLCIDWLRINGILSE